MNGCRESFECATNDELMLKELERRDGIYSFIFHELEAPRGQPPPPPHSLPQPPGASCQQLLTFAEFPEEPMSGSSNGSNGSTGSTATSNSSRSSSCGADTTIESRPPPAGHEPLKPWNPPPSLAFDHPQLYAYMANCGFRVRVPPPRFSHVSAPLVRNRRHALKDSPEYKRCGRCLLDTPDLRPLFPHDPDVHAPFAAAAAASGQPLPHS